MSTASGPQVWLVRHGETEWSRTGQHTGASDLPLTTAGEQAAGALVDRLDDDPFDLVLTSPLQRAHRTAELAGFADAEIEPDLVEWDYGSYEGLTTPQIRETVAEWTVWTHGAQGGEDAAAVGRRLDRVVARLRDGGDRCLVFAHGHCLRALAARWLGQPASDGRFYRLDTATVSVLGYERETPVIVRWNA